MKNKLISVTTILLTVFLISSISALNLKIEKISEGEVLIPETGNPVSFTLKITNLGEADNLEFYNLLGLRMFPVGKIPISGGETKEIELKVSPIGKFEYKGVYNFEYYIKGESSEIKERLSFRIVEIKDAFSVGSGEFYPDSNSMDVYIKNNANFNFENIKADFSSSFFKVKEEFPLMPYEKKSFTVQLNKEDFKKLMAGYYTLNADVKAGEAEASVVGVIKFLEKDIVTSTKKEYGFVVNTQTISKSNEGNIVTKSETIIKKNIISRLFTSFSPEPDSVERQGVDVYYSWLREIKPGEKFEIVVKTNWLLPVLIIILIIVVVVLSKQYTKTNLVMKKNVSFVRAKGGEFALKVSVIINAKKYIEKVKVSDRLPPLVNVYERFGGEKPSRIDEKSKIVEWNFDRLMAGETRMLSYIIYSKVGVVGRFALPSASAVYEKDGQMHESESNKAFFVAEPRGKDSED